MDEPTVAPRLQLAGTPAVTASGLAQALLADNAEHVAACCDIDGA